ncbi:hypothetical protein [Rhodococcus sp. HNM0563]|uniref:hypothetical protein n=1 Tax=Rhodococcus sp. HNM0563 TaxID=2716339 RepID=UPI0019805CEF|nr:hypothetical protein [Rhodococcus sp. HNM0563]
MGSIGKADIGSLMLWKRLNLSTIWSRELNEWSDRDGRAVTGGAFDLARDASRSIPEAAGAARSALLTLLGCRQGAAIASTLLTAGASDRMAVYDRRAVDELRILGYSSPNGFCSRFMVTMCELTESVNSTAGFKWCPATWTRHCSCSVAIVSGPYLLNEEESDWGLVRIR